MKSRLTGNRPTSTRVSSPIHLLLFAMLAIFASLYVAGRLWQDAENRVYLINELDKRTGQGHSAVSVDDTLKIIACREQQKKLSALEMELSAARKDGFVSKPSTQSDGGRRKKLLAVVGIATQFGHRRHRNAVRKAWMPNGDAMAKMEDQKGIVARFVIGRSANGGDSLDKEIDIERETTNDFIIIDDHVEAPEEHPRKTKLFLAHAVERWDAEFYVKVNDNVFVNIDGLGAILSANLDKPRVYIGCMKSGEVFSEPGHKWYEPEWWKFGNGKSYFQHASGDIFVISHALAQFVSINRYMLRTYAHDDVSVGSWFIGLDVKHIDEEKLCCSSSMSSGAVCAAV